MADAYFNPYTQQQQEQQEQQPPQQPACEWTETNQTIPPIKMTPGWNDPPMIQAINPNAAKRAPLNKRVSFPINGMTGRQSAPFANNYGQPPSDYATFNQQNGQFASGQSPPFAIDNSVMYNGASAGSHLTYGSYGPQ